MMHDGSDIDIGMLRSFGEGDFHLPDTEISSMSDRKVSIFDMRKSYSVRFIEEIITSGQLIYVADAEEVARFEKDVKKAFKLYLISSSVDKPY